MVLKRKIGAGARSSPAPMLRRQRLTFAADLTSGKTMCTNTTAVTVTGSWTIYPWGWQFTRSEGLDEAYVPSFGTLGAAWDDAMVARWSANPLGMLWPEMDAAFAGSGGGGGAAAGGPDPGGLISDYGAGTRLQSEVRPHGREVKATVPPRAGSLDPN